MSALSIDQKVAVIGAGTMGAGIAQVAADAGHSVVLIDVAEGAAQKGKENIQRGLEPLIEKGRRHEADVVDLLSRIRTSQNIADCAGCALVIEAIIEDLDIKRRVFNDVEKYGDDMTIIASNTSSISISELSADAKRPDNIVGMHFFNPAAILKLVEVVSGLQTSSKNADIVYQTAIAWGKQPVHAKSTPGFIVNRVARPFYAEALRSLTEQVADVATLDSLMRSCGGFKMGPLELTDLIGQDINNAVTNSVYQAFYQDKRFMPSVLQAEMTAAGLLGRKSGRGFYDYSIDKPAATVETTRAQSNVVNHVKVIGALGYVNSLISLIEKSPAQLQVSAEGLARIEVGDAIIQLTDGRTASQRAAEQCTPNLVLLDYAVDYDFAPLIALSFGVQSSLQAQEDAVAFFQSLGKQVCILKDVPGMQVLRTIAMLVNEAHDAVNQGVCDAAAVDTAMKAGVAYPQGPIEWGQSIGLKYLSLVLRNIQSAYGEERYRVSPRLVMESYNDVK